MKAYNTSFLLDAKFVKKKLKIPILTKNSFCRNQIYIKILKKCLISLGIPNQFQQMRSQMEAYSTCCLYKATIHSSMIIFWCNSLHKAPKQSCVGGGEE